LHHNTVIIFYIAPLFRLVLIFNSPFYRALHLEPVQLLPEPRGSLQSLVPSPPQRLSDVDHQRVFVGIKAVGLNFRDLLNVLGMYPGDPGPPGGDCAGIILDAGRASGHDVGDWVFGIAPGCLGTAISANGQTLAPMPPTLSPEAACSVPTTFITAYACLEAAWRTQPGQRVLIHAATGGLGNALIQVTRAAAGTSLGTAGSPYKRAFIRESYEMNAVYDSRSTSFGADLVASRLSPDVVINSLTSAGMVAASLASLHCNGAFVEVGKRDIWSAALCAQERPDVHFHTVAIDFMTPDVISNFLRKTAAMLGSGN
jgi:NADPH:quinone reductase-like Zn-dependent oxidoreductase